MAKEQEKKKGNHTGAKVGVAALLLALLGGGGYFGLGGGGEGGGLFPNGQSSQASADNQAVVSSQEETQTESQTQNTYEDDNVLEIVVTEDGILYEGRSVTAVALEEALLSDYKEGVSVKIKDDHAIKASYDEVTALLSKLNIDYTAE